MGLFNKINYKTAYEEKLQDYKDLIQRRSDDQSNYNRDREYLIHTHALQIENIESEHTLALKQKEFELKHHKDEEIKAAEQKVTEIEKKVAVLEAENKMLDEISDWNKDIIDIKDLVKNLINKLPEVKINSLSVTGGGSTK